MIAFSDQKGIREVFYSEENTNEKALFMLGFVTSDDTYNGMLRSSNHH